MGGRRLSQTWTFEGDAVDVDLQVLSPWTVIDVCVNFSAQPTTSEMVTIYRLDMDGVNWYQGGADISSSDAGSPEATSQVFRFDKRFQAGDTLRVDFANTDAEDISVCVQYQTDDLDY